MSKTPKALHYRTSLLCPFSQCNAMPMNQSKHHARHRISSGVSPLPAPFFHPSQPPHAQLKPHSSPKCPTSLPSSSSASPPPAAEPSHPAHSDPDSGPSAASPVLPLRVPAPASVLERALGLPPARQLGPEGALRVLVGLRTRRCPRP